VTTVLQRDASIMDTGTVGLLPRESYTSVRLLLEIDAGEVPVAVEGLRRIDCHLRTYGWMQARILWR